MNTRAERTLALAKAIDAIREDAEKCLDEAVQEAAPMSLPPYAAVTFDKAMELAASISDLRDAIDSMHHAAIALRMSTEDHS